MLDPWNTVSRDWNVLFLEPRRVSSGSKTGAYDARRFAERSVLCFRSIFDMMSRVRCSGGRETIQLVDVLLHLVRMLESFPPDDCSLATRARRIEARRSRKQNPLS